jgi:hypothetical protein
MFERVYMARRCRKRAAEWNNRAETALTAEERCRQLMVAEHYRALAESAERSLNAAWEERFPRMLTALHGRTTIDGESAIARLSAPRVLRSFG